MTPAQMYQQGMRNQYRNAQEQQRMLAQMLKNGGMGARPRQNPQQGGGQGFAVGEPNPSAPSTIPNAQPPIGGDGVISDLSGVTMPDTQPQTFPARLDGSMIPRMDTQPQNPFPQNAQPTNVGSWNNPINRMRDFAMQKNPNGFAVGEPNPSMPNMPRPMPPRGQMPRPIPRPASPPIMPNPNVPQTMY